MKIYHTETVEDYDALMVELEEQGCKWLSERKPTEAKYDWFNYGKKTCVRVSSGILTKFDFSYSKENYPSVPIIKYKAKVNEKMKIYHTETQEDYVALMVELEVEGCAWLSGRKPTEATKYWKLHSRETCVKVDEKVIEFEPKRYYTSRYPDVSITKYKAKADDRMKFTKENVLNLTDKWIKNKIVSFPDLQNEIKELDDTPEKVVVPKCFDEWFKEIVFEYPMTDSSKRFALWKLSQQGFGYGFERANGEKIPYDTDLGKWLFKNRELAIEAVLNGYTIEREQLYYIPLPYLETAGGTKQYLTKSGAGNYFALSPCVGQKQRYTKAELEQVPEIYKPFAVPVKEEGQ